MMFKKTWILIPILCLSALTTNAIGANDCCFTVDTDGNGDLDCVSAGNQAACTAAGGAGLYFAGWSCGADGDRCDPKSGQAPLECYGTDSNSCREVPTISEWGVAAMALLTMISATVLIQRRAITSP